MNVFSGAYRQDDIAFLLEPVVIKMTSIEEKERLIQSGEKHYSDLLTQEPAPSATHLSLYQKALEQGEVRLAKEVLALAKRLADDFADQDVVLVSLVRAGVPLGVMLHRALKNLGHKSFHYGISIIRDRGIDFHALQQIEQKHSTQQIVFVDGWTGKGMISNQLKHSLKGRTGYDLPRLVVLADPCGVAWLSASLDDWLIPFGILGAPVSGLVSRSLWSETGYHGCMVCSHLAAYECGVSLVDRIEKLQQNLTDEIHPATNDIVQINTVNQKSKRVIEDIQHRYQISAIHRLKPGIAEATRAVLRRVPKHVLVQDQQDKDVALLIHLAQEKGIHVTEEGSLLGPYRAMTIIQKVC